MTDDCIFCKIANQDIPVELLYEDEIIAAFRDINPVAPVHILIIPRKHIPSILDITDVEADMMGRILEVANRLARQYEIADSGFRLVLNTGPDAGQSVQHLHAHLLGGRAMAWPPG